MSDTATKPSVTLLAAGEKAHVAEKGHVAVAVRPNGDDSFDLFGTAGAVVSFSSDNVKAVAVDGVSGSRVALKINHVAGQAVTEGSANIDATLVWANGQFPPCTVKIPVELVDAPEGGTMTKIGTPTVV